MSITEQASRAQQTVNPLIYETEDEELKEKLQSIAVCLRKIVTYSVVTDELT